MNSPTDNDRPRKQPKSLLITQIALILTGGLGGATLSLCIAPENGVLATGAFLVGTVITAVINYLTERDD
jgi:hypothetical protein